METTDSQYLCPTCDNRITKEQINISEGIALCNTCEELTKLSDLNSTGMSTDQALSDYDKDTTLHSDGREMRITVSHFSILKFLGGLAAAIFWNGIVSVFVSFAVAAVAYNIFGPLPDWFPTLGLEDGTPIMNDSVISWPMTIYLCLFLSPFVVIGLGMIVNTLMMLFGTTKVKISETGSSVSSGIAFLRWSRRFDARDVQAIKLVPSKFNQEGQTNQVIAIVQNHRKKPVKFGLLMSSEQQERVMLILRALLLHKNFPDHIRRLNWL